VERQLSYQDIHNFTHNIIDQIDKDNFVPGIVAGFCRGGMIPAIIMSHYYNCRFLPIELSLRDNAVVYNHDGIFAINDAMRDGINVIIVDDICDTGKTFLTFRDRLSIINPMDKGKEFLKTAALQKRYGAVYKPTYFAEFINNDDWQIFPWEAK
jgi:hypoxanthine phosphoribosyltransferase